MDTTPAPVSAPSRVASLDVLRGFALLGILAPNSLFFAWPQLAATAETMGDAVRRFYPGVEVHERANSFFLSLIDTMFVGKFMFLFATLFGAGLFFFDRKFHDKDERVPLHRGAALWYTRIGWLMIIGLLHAFGLWFGDILVWYSAAGLVLIWWVRRWSPPVLIGCAVISYLVGLSLMLTMFALSAWAIESGQMSAEEAQGIPLAQELLTYRDGSYGETFFLRVQTLGPWYLIMPFTFFWQVTGLFMLGLALTKLGVYTGQRSARFYAVMGFGGVGLGVPVVFLAYRLVTGSGSPMSHMYWMVGAQAIGVPLALGYAGLVLLMVRTGALRPVAIALAAVGRMALSNYLLQTILCTTLFYGYGFGQYAQLQFPQLAYVVLSVWALNITFSLLWLRVFRFGPAEWLWRSLTYLRPQPLLKAPTKTSA